tara:strand:+ start:594 stop:1325 length:732 start_codon:yes stop_codon:yes gene_type:complete
MKKAILIFLFSTFLNVNAQDNKQSAFTFNYNYQIPTADLANTFGNNSAIGASYFSETNDNLFYGIGGNYMFGNNVKDTTLFDNISTSIGGIIDASGHYANINLLQRGFNTHIFVGYAFHFTNNNLSGIYLSQGVGYMQYQIFIDTKNQNIPQLNEEMKKGYDRFSNGISTKFSADYKYYHKKGKFQISSGVNYTMAYTKIQRAYDFANKEYYSSKRKWDQLLGFKLELIIPIHRKNEEEFHYY